MRVLFNVGLSLTIAPALTLAPSLEARWRRQAAPGQAPTTTAGLSPTPFEPEIPKVEAAARTQRPDLFVEDGPHLMPAGCALWTRILTPVLESGSPQ